MTKKQTQKDNSFPELRENLIRLVNYFQRHNRFIFIMGHMRSGSTLLLHILATNPEIIAGGERNKVYNTVNDLNSLISEICLQQNILISHRKIFLDQINHEKMTPNIDILNTQNLKRVFLLRKPLATISSIVNTFEPIYGNWPVERAVNYYIQRIKNLELLAKEISSPNNSMLVKYEELTDVPAIILDSLQKFLALKKPLTTRYKLQKYTGSRGDPSERIVAGKILHSNGNTDIKIPLPLLNSANSAYTSCISTIQEYSITL